MEDLLQHVHAPLVLGNPVLDMASPVLSRGEDALPWPAGNALPHVDQEAVSLLCCRSTLLAHVQLGIHQDPQVPFCQASSQTVSPQHVLVHEAICPRVQNLALPIVKLHEIPARPFLQPVDVPLDSSTTVWHISHSSQFSVL